VAYAYQNRRAYLQEKQADAVHQRGREFAALRVMTFIALRFERGERPPTLAQLAEATGVPTRLANNLLQLLVTRKIVAEIRDRETAYVPVRPLNQVSAHDILDAVRTGQGMDLATRDDPVRTLVQAEFGRIATAELSVAGNITLQTLVDKVAAGTQSG
jgi:membrane protein